MSVVARQGGSVKGQHGVCCWENDQSTQRSEWFEAVAGSALGLLLPVRSTPDAGRNSDSERVCKIYLSGLDKKCHVYLWCF